MPASTFLTRVAVRNYKSIEACDVDLTSLTFLVGKNGSGKSNFLDAIRFVAESLRTSLDHALRDRGGINEVRRRSGGHPTNFAIRLDFQLSSGQSGHYAFRIGAMKKGAFTVKDEECHLRGTGDRGATYFRVRNGELTSHTFPVGPAVAHDRLYLVAASGIKELTLLYQSLSRMGFYNINPDEMRKPQPPDPGELLLRDGRNVASVFRRLARENGAPARVSEYLSKLVPGLEGVQPKEVGSHETLEFRQSVKGAKYPWRFEAITMSDGTLRAVGILVALFQAKKKGPRTVPLIGVEEPEAALHPAAAGVLLDSLVEASESTQVIVTSHSPDLLDTKQVDAGQLLAVVLDESITKIGPVDEASRSLLRDDLYTPGELLRLDQLSPDENTLKNSIQLKLFGGPPKNEPSP